MQTLQENTTLQGGKYRILRVLGQGGFGITYLAEQTMLERRVAIKEFYMKEFCSRDGSTSHVTIGTEGSRETVTRFREKFLKEARNIAKLNHPNIVKIIDVFEENGTAYYVMEYAEGGSLADKVKREGYLSEPVATRYILQVAEALAYVHARKMNHLDVKPANIMLTGTDSAVLIDFGLSKQYDIGGQQTSTTPVGISEGYAPMEQYKQGGVGEFSPETDIYALGATFFKLLTGITPPSASDVNEDGVPVDELKAKGVSDKAIEVICEVMRSRKKDRMKEAKGFIEALGGNKGKTSTKIVGDEETVMNVQAALKEESVKVEKEAPKRKQERFLIRGPEWKGNLLIALLTIIIAGIVAIPMGLGGYLKKITQNNNDDLLVIPYQFDVAEDFSEGLACVSKDGKWGYIDKEGNVKIPFIYDKAWTFSDGLARIEKEKKYGYIDKSGDEVIPCQYDFSIDFSEGLAMVVKKGKYGYINTHGEFTIPCQYPYNSDEILFYEFHDGMTVVKNGKKYGFIDKTGHEVIPCQYDDARDFSEGMAMIQKGTKYGYIDKYGNEIISCQYDFGGAFSEGLALVSKSGKIGIIDKKGKVVIPFLYDGGGFSWAFSDGLATVSRGEHMGCIDKTGNEVIPFEYGVIGFFSNGLAVVVKDNKWGFIDKKGNEVISCIYDDVRDFSEDLAVVKKNDKYGYIKKPE